MVIGLLTLDLQIPASGSLKDKRSVVRSLVSRLRQDFNISVAEVEHQDSWQRCGLAAACVSTDSAAAQRLLQRVVDYVNDRAGEYIVLDIATEML